MDRSREWEGDGFTAHQDGNVPVSTTLADLLLSRSASEPNRKGYSFLSYRNGENPEIEYLTYDVLAQRSKAIAASLQATCSKGDCVLILCPPGLNYIVSFFGCQLAGVVAVPAYPPRNVRHMGRLEAILSDADASAVLVTKDIAGKVAAWASDELPHFLVVDDVSIADASRWALPDIAHGDLAFLQYTSGTTGAPKGVMVTQDAVLTNANIITKTFDLSPKSCGVFWLPPYHDMGLVGAILVPLLAGFCSHLLTPAAFLQNPMRWLKALSEMGATITTAPNFAWQLCAEAAVKSDLDTIDLSKLRHALSGAEPVRHETLAAFTKAFELNGFEIEKFVPVYGMAETVLLATAKPHRAPRRHDFRVSKPSMQQGQRSRESARQMVVSCGSVISGHNIRVVDPETCLELSDGKSGEIWLQGPSVASGYWNKPDETRATFKAVIANAPEAGRWLRTGDLGTRSDDELYILGRIKEMMIVRGVNHYPQDLEATVSNAHPGLRTDRAASFSVVRDSDGRFGDPSQEAGEEQLVIVQELDRKGIREFPHKEVCHAIRRALVMEHEVEPCAVLLIRPASLPRTTSGKIQRLTVRAMFLDGTLSEVARWHRPVDPDHAAVPPPGSGTQGDLARWLQALVGQALDLPIDDIPLDQGIYALGMESLMAVRLARQVEAALDLSFEPSALYETPTLDDLAKHLSARLSGLPDPAPQHAYPVPPAFSTHTRVAIIGLACRFPGGNNAEAFWRLLHEGRSAIDTAPGTRWPRADAEHKEIKGGFLDGIDLFDAPFFRITPAEARLMDPQQRLLLETAWSALEIAGIAPDTLRGSNTGLYIGLSTQDYNTLITAGDADAASPHRGTGGAGSVAAGRLAYTLGLNGPAMVIDTACSSSLVAVHQACRALLSRETDLALAGGVNAILDPQISEVFSNAGMLSKDGRCKTFDAQADGYVRGEGCGVVALKRLSDAEADGDPILAVIRGSAVNQDGASAGLTVPSGAAQTRVIEAALRRANLAPGDVDYLEAHGTGTELGDPIELRAAAAAYGAGRDPERPLLVGSVKTNIGHLEAAAGVAGLIKVVLSLQGGVIPKHLNFNTPSPHIDWDKLPLRVTSTAIPLSAQTGSGRPARAAISSFGFSGTNAHLIVERDGASPAQRRQPYQRRSAVKDASVVDAPRQCRVLTLSGKTAPALREIAKLYLAWLDNLIATSDGNDDVWAALRDGAFSAATGRSHFGYRVGLVFGDVEELKNKLDALARADDGAIVAGNVPGLASGSRPPSAPAPKIAFLFTGQGSQWPGMGRALYRTEPVFRATLDRCDDLIREIRGVSLLDVLFGEKAAPGHLDDTAWTQPGLYALQSSLVAFWESLGIRPSVVMGHSVGEIAAAHAAGVFDLEEGLKFAAERGMLMSRLPTEGPQAGAMATVFAPRAQVQTLIDALNAETTAGSLSIAAENGTHRIVSGSAHLIAGFEQRCSVLQVRCSRLRTRHAFHSELMDPILADLEAAAPGVTGTARATVISNVTGAAIVAEHMDRTYWRRHARDAVQFDQGVTTLAETGADLVIELGPQGVLGPLAAMCWPGSGPSPRILSSLSGPGKGADAASDFAQAVASVYAAGATPSFQGLYAGEKPAKAALPTYPFQRRRYWVDSERNPDSKTANPLGKPVEASPSIANEAPTVEPSSVPYEVVQMTPTVSSQTQAALQGTQTVLFSLLEEVTGCPEAEIRNAESLYALGLDSILVATVVSRLNQRLNLDLKAVDFLQANRTVEELAAHLHSMRGEKEAHALPGVQTKPPGSDHDRSEPAQPAQMDADGGPGTDKEKSHSDLFALQIRAMEKHSEAMRALFEGQLELQNKVEQESGPTITQPDRPEKRTQFSQSNEISFADAKNGLSDQPGSGALATPAAEKRHLDNLQDDYVPRTKWSKALTAQDRRVFASLRNRAGFRLETKEFQYPISLKRSEGATVYDVDGNCYVDIVMGFGVNLFGHHPEFVRGALLEEIDAQTPLAAASPVAGDVARLISELTKVERVCFFSTGSEAVMVAVRIARAATGRRKVVIFERSYHGHADAILPSSDGSAVGSMSGIAGVKGDVVVLPYGAQDSLDWIEKNAREAACVLVEPVQSRDPANQPVRFLRTLRAVTRQLGVPLVFDEIITGFRSAPGGAQEIFGVDADLVTYGKVAGGGLPIGIVAGSAAYMDLLDGGVWAFGDGSQPRLDTVLAAGTFNNHPLSLTAARAVMTRLKDAGPRLQRELGEKTARLCDRFDDLFQSTKAPISVSRFGSMFRFDPRFQRDLFRLNLLNNGVHFLEAGSSFISTEHTDADFDTLLRALEKSIWTLSKDGVIASRGTRRKTSNEPPPPETPNVHTESGKWHGHEKLAQLTARVPEAALAHRETVAVELTGPIQPENLVAAFDQTIQRHEILRAASGEEHCKSRLEIAEPHEPADAVLRKLAAGAIADLGFSSHTFQARLIPVGRDSYIFVLVAGHAIMDGWSIGLLLGEMAATYNAIQHNRPIELQSASRYSDFVAWSDSIAAPKADTPSGSHRMLLKPANTKSGSEYEGGRVWRIVGAGSDLGDVFQNTRSLASRLAVSPMSVALASFMLLAARMCNRRDVLVGVPMAGQLAADMQHLIGPCTAIVPIKVAIDPGQTFESLTRAVQQELTEALTSCETAFSKHEPAQFPPDILFNIDQAGNLDLNNVRAKRLPVGRHHVARGLSLNIQSNASSVQFDLDWSSAFLDEDTANRWLSSYLSILSVAVRSPENSVARLPLSDGDENAQRSVTDLRTIDAFGGTAPVGVVAQVEQCGDDGEWHKTDRVGRLKIDGDVEILGPSHKFLRNEFCWIDLREVDLALSQVAGVGRAETLRIVDEQGKPELVAFLELERGGGGAARRLEFFDVPGKIAANSVSEALAGIMPASARPDRLVGVSTLPRDDTGAVDHERLAERFRQKGSDLKQEAPPRTGGIPELFRSCLGVATCEPSDNFFELGGTSLSAIRLLRDIENTAGKRLSVHDFYRAPSIAGIEAALGSKKKRPENTAPQIEQDIHQGREIGRPSNANVPPRKPRCLLLTGGTGFLGRHVLKDLLESDVERIFCLCRGRSLEETTRHLRETLESVGCDHGAEQKIHIVLGDLGLPCLSLDASDFEAIAQSCDAVVHAGADVNFVKTYSDVRCTNVLSAIELLRLCARGTPKTFHLISTLGVFGYSEYRSPTPATKPTLAGLDTGYAQSKWAAEQILQEAGERGFSVQILRPPQILGDARTGRYENSDIATDLLDLICDIECIPDFPNLRVPAVNVDRAAARIVSAVLENNPTTPVLHLANGQGLSVGDVIKAAAAQGISIHPVPLKTFLDRASRFIGRNPDHRSAWVQRIIEDRVRSMPRALSTFVLRPQPAVKRANGGRRTLETVEADEKLLAPINWLMSRRGGQSPSWHPDEYQSTQV